jgi:NAD(P)-dependent dehydrogenase (short-subunit alcohol dehydrogenase family)
MLLEGKTAMVTGAAQGIGEFIARAFRAEGARVALCDIDEARLSKTAASLGGSHGAVSPHPLDVTNREQVRSVVASIHDEFGKIEILVNNAGAYPRMPFLEMTDSEWDRIIDLNLNGTYNCTRAVAPLMAAHADGAIVNISSVTYFLGMAHLTHYVAAKGGIIGFTRTLARDLGEHNIRVNCISPGAVATESERQFGAPEEIGKVVLPLQSLKRRIMPDDIARVAVFLASSYAAGMTGQTLNVDGGWVMY